jgi:enamine deaminase RidA (YjgF/YER057c/UK114 family)
MKTEYVNPKTLSKPGAYTHMVSAAGAEKLVYVSGQVSYAADGSVLGKGDIRAQSEQVFANVTEALKAGGAGWGDVIKLNGYHGVVNDRRLGLFSRGRHLTLAPLMRPRLARACFRHVTSMRAAFHMADFCRRNQSRRRSAFLDEQFRLIDEGSLHRLCTLASKGWIDRHEQLLSEVTLPDAVVYLTLDVRSARRRLRQRAALHGRPERRHWWSWHLRYQETASLVLDQLSAPCLTIDASEHIAVDKVAAWIVALSQECGFETRSGGREAFHG